MSKYEDRSAEELRDLARERGLAVSGTKDELISRLRGESAATDDEAPDKAAQKKAGEPSKGGAQVDITGRAIPEGAATDWRVDLLLKANSSDAGEKARAQETLDRIFTPRLNHTISQEEVKAFASLGYGPAIALLGPGPGPSDPSHPGNPIGTEVHAGTTGKAVVEPEGA